MVILNHEKQKHQAQAAAVLPGSTGAQKTAAPN
jgi:hypothetical protein